MGEPHPKSASFPDVFKSIIRAGTVFFRRGSNELWEIPNFHQRTALWAKISEIYSYGNPDNAGHFSDSRGNLTVIERVIPFEHQKAIRHLTEVDMLSPGGKHRHRKTIQAAIWPHARTALHHLQRRWPGSGSLVSEHNCPESAYFLEPKDWHFMYDFS